MKATTTERKRSRASCGPRAIVWTTLREVIEADSHLWEIPVGNTLHRIQKYSRICLIRHRLIRQFAQFVTFSWVPAEFLSRTVTRGRRGGEAPPRKILAHLGKIYWT